MAGPGRQVDQAIDGTRSKALTNVGVAANVARPSPGDLGCPVGAAGVEIAGGSHTAHLAELLE
jgi:hypothetical protein